MNRRNFITLLGGAAAWPLAARAQQGDRMRQIGVLMPGDENDPLRKTRLSVFTQALATLGWAEGRNVRMDVRWHGDDPNRVRVLAQELVGLQPEIICKFRPTRQPRSVTARIHRRSRRHFVHCYRCLSNLRVQS